MHLNKLRTRMHAYVCVRRWRWACWQRAAQADSNSEAATSKSRVGGRSGVCIYIENEGSSFLVLVFSMSLKGAGAFGEPDGGRQDQNGQTAAAQRRRGPKTARGLPQILFGEPPGGRPGLDRPNGRSETTSRAQNCVRVAPDSIRGASGGSPGIRPGKRPQQNDVEGFLFEPFPSRSAYSMNKASSW